MPTLAVTSRVGWPTPTSVGSRVGNPTSTNPNDLGLFLDRTPMVPVLLGSASIQDGLESTNRFLAFAAACVRCRRKVVAIYWPGRALNSSNCLQEKGPIQHATQCPRCSKAAQIEI